VEKSSPAADALPPAPRLVPRRRQPPRRRTALTVDAIVAAAIEVLDDGGVAGLTMRRVAERLQTGAGSLYAHVSGREELLELVFDELVGRVALPEPDSERWREQIMRLCTDLRDVLTSHRDAALAGLGTIPTSPKVMAASEALCAVLRAGGLTDRTVVLGFDLLMLYVAAFSFEAGLRENLGADEAEIERYFAEAHAFYAALPASRFPVLASLAEEMTDHDGDERFAFGIGVLVAGLEATSARG